MAHIVTTTTNLLERIKEIESNSVTPDEFKELWGYTLDELVEDMMDYIHKLKSTEMVAE